MTVGARVRAAHKLRMVGPLPMQKSPALLAITPAFVAIATLSSSPGDAGAFDLKHTDEGVPVRWAREDGIRVAVHPVGDARKDAMLTRSARIAINAWNAAGAVSLVHASETDVAAPAAEIVIGWANGVWEDNPERLATTRVEFNSESGGLETARITINDVQHTWSVIDERRGTPSPMPFDLPSTVTHELGHALGLEHSDIEDATMHRGSFAGETRKRTLHRDDLDAIQTLYAEDTSLERGGCSAAGRGVLDVWLLVVAGVIFVLNRRRVARRHPRI
jgi:hypothetical protein